MRTDATAVKRLVTATTIAALLGGIGCAPGRAAHVAVDGARGAAPIADQACHAQEECEAAGCEG